MKNNDVTIAQYQFAIDLLKSMQPKYVELDDISPASITISDAVEWGMRKQANLDNLVYQRQIDELESTLKGLTSDKRQTVEDRLKESIRRSRM